MGWDPQRTTRTASRRSWGKTSTSTDSRRIFSKILFRPVRTSRRTSTCADQHDEILNHDVNVLVILKLHAGRNFSTSSPLAGSKASRSSTPSRPPVRRMLTAADAVIADSDESRNIVPRRHRHKLHIVFDGYEHEPSIAKEHHDERTLKLCLVSITCRTPFRVSPAPARCHVEDRRSRSRDPGGSFGLTGLSEQSVRFRTCRGSWMP